MIGFYPDPKKYSAPKIPKGLKKGKSEPTGELALFKQIYIERKGKCQITGEPIEFHPISFMHILSKGAYPKYRLNKNNIYMVVADIHLGYDSGSKEFLLKLYPKAKIIYELKDELKISYYEKPPTI